jgi:hypothetical protein
LINIIKAMFVILLVLMPFGIFIGLVGMAIRNHMKDSDREDGVVYIVMLSLCIIASVGLVRYFQGH